IARLDLLTETQASSFTEWWGLAQSTIDFRTCACRAQEHIPDFVLYPTLAHKEAIMLALDSSRQQQTSYFHDVPMDPALVDPFGFQMDNFGGFGQPSGSASAPTSYYDASPVYADSQLEAKTAGFPPMPPTPPSLPVPYSTEPYMSGLSTASGPSIASASSSAIGSPYSGIAQTFPESWVDTNHGIGLPAAVMDEFFPSEFMASSLEAENIYQRKGPGDFVDPSLIQPVHQYPSYSTPTISFPEPSGYSANCGYFPQSPDPSHLPIAESYAADHFSQTGLAVSSPLLNSAPHSRPVSIYDRRSSISSTHSRRSQLSPAASVAEFDDESKEKGRCPHPDCGRVFKDLKAHMLTHQSERPEKCPIVTCEYHVKGFARKYDKNRHTLTHYKGTMVCGFCPGSGSPAEKSFNRADVFKRHLTSVHGVEQTPPNCRKRSPAASSGKKVSDYCQDATGKCSTCSATFTNAQDFYEHLDDCVLRVVQQVEPSEVINQQRLAEVDCDEEVKKTMEKHKLLDAAGDVDRLDDEPEEDDNDYNELNLQLRSSKGAFKSNKGNASVGARPILGSSNAVTKNSKTRATISKRRNNRDRYPPSWGCPSSSMKTKKRVLCVFDGQRRLWKDEMMLDNEFEVRLKLPGGASDGTNREAYITDLDVETLKRAEGVLSANEDERGPWLEGPATHLIGQPARILPTFSHPHDDVDIDELMS
ncbi:5',5'''-P-1,P-4-tetraphosphate phosphorylase 2, partial [Aspergillus udagawae]